MSTVKISHNHNFNELIGTSIWSGSDCAIVEDVYELESEFGKGNVAVLDPEYGDCADSEFNSAVLEKLF